MSIFNILQLNQFARLSAKEIGKSEGGIYILKSEQAQESSTKYQVKTSLTKSGVVNEFAASYILRQLIGDRAPENFIIKLDNQGGLGIASKFISGFTSKSDYKTNKAKESLKAAFAKDMESAISPSSGSFFSAVERELLEKPKRYDHDDYSTSALELEANMLARFIDHKDFHDQNRGLVVGDDQIKKAALIDFDNSLVKLDLPNLGLKIPSSRYTAGIESALKVLTTLKQFDLSSLDKLDSIFAQINASDELLDIKKFMKGKLQEVNKEIEICQLALKLENKTITDAEYQVLINSNLDMFTLFDENNPTVTAIYKRQDEQDDLSVITKVVNKDMSLVPSLVRYSWANNKDLLFKIIPSLASKQREEVVKKAINKCHNLEELKVAIDLAEIANVSIKGVDEIKECLLNDYSNIDKLLNRSFYSDDIDLFLILKIAIQGLKEDKIKRIDSDGAANDLLKIFYHENDVQGMVKLLNAVSLKDFPYWPLAFHSENLDFAKSAISRVNDVQTLKKYALSLTCEKQIAFQSFQEDLCNLYKDRIEEMGLSFAEQDIKISFAKYGSPTLTHNCNDVLVAIPHHEEL